MSYFEKDELLTVKEVSDFLKLSVLTIYKYIKSKELEASEFGGHFRIKRSSLEEFILRHKVSTAIEEPQIKEESHE